MLSRLVVAGEAGVVQLMLERAVHLDGRAIMMRQPCAKGAMALHG